MYLSENKKDDLEDAMTYDSLEDIPDDLEMYLSSRNYDELYEPNAPDYSTDIFPQEPEAYLSENDKSDQAVEHLRIDWSKNYKLALDYMYGNEQNKSAVIKKDPEKAFEILSIESKSGNIIATYDIGKLYDSQMLKSNDGDTLSQQYYSKAFEDFHKLLSIVSMSDDKRDNWTKSYLNYRIGKMYEYGLGVTQDYNSAIEHYKLSENKYAYFALGNIYKYGSGVETDYAKAFDYYMRSLSSKGGMPFASYAVGQAYELGQGVEKDLSSAHNFYAEALTGLEKVFTKNHDDNISYKIGMMYLNGKGTDIDLECAEKYLLLSADSNNYKAQYMLGKLYQSDSKKDLQKAEKVLIKGAENAQDKTGLCEYSLGKLYLSQERYDKAASYLERSAAKDNYYAAYTLGKLYQEQFNDNTQAEKYLLQAADHKDDTMGIAAYRLGICLKITDEKHCSISRMPLTKIAYLECMLQGKFFLIAENQQKFQKEYATFHQPPIRTLSLRYTLWANIIAHSIIQKLKNTLSVLRLNTTIQMHSIFLEKCICLKIKTKWLKSASVSAL